MGPFFLCIIDGWTEKLWRFVQDFDKETSKCQALQEVVLDKLGTDEGSPLTPSWVKDFSWTVFNSYCIRYSRCTVYDICIYIVHVYVSTMLHSLKLPWHNCYDTSSIHPWLHFGCTLKSESFQDFNVCFSTPTATLQGNCRVHEQTSCWTSTADTGGVLFFRNLIFDGLSLRHSKEGVTGLCTSCVGLFHIFLRFHVDLRGVCEISTISWSHFIHTFRGPKKQMMPSKVEVLESFLSFFRKYFSSGN